MGALLKKDFLTSRYIYSVITLIVAVVLVFVIRINSVGGMMIAVLGSVIIPVIVNKFTATEEMRKNYDVVMNSFPVRRKDVVVSKYMYYVMLHFFTAVILQGIVLLNHYGNVEVLVAVLIAQGLAFLYYILMVGLPNFIYYSFDYEVAIKFSTIIILVVVYTPILLMGFIDRINPNIRMKVIEYISKSENSGFKLAGMLFSIGVILYVIIIALSTRGYRRRDL